MPVPPQCQLLVDEIGKLQGQIVEVGELAGQARLEAVASNLNIQQQITQKQQKLKACLIAFGGFSTQVVLLDFTPGGGTVTLPLNGTLWRLWTTTSTVENQTVQSGQVSFVNGPCDPLGALLAISVDETPNTTFTGPLFRSGAVETLYDGAPGNPPALIVPAHVLRLCGSLAPAAELLQRASGTVAQARAAATGSPAWLPRPRATAWGAAR